MTIFRDHEGNFYDVPDDELQRYRVQGDLPEGAQLAGDEVGDADQPAQAAHNYAAPVAHNYPAPAYNYQHAAAYNYQPPAYNYQRAPAYNYQPPAYNYQRAAAYNYDPPAAGGAAYNYQQSTPGPAYNYEPGQGQGGAGQP
jgi:hypothetical protein